MIRQKTFAIFLGILFFNTSILGNFFSDFYNFMFYEGIALKQDTEPKEWSTFRREKNYKHLWAAFDNLISARKEEFNRKYLKNEKIKRIGKKVRLIKAPTKIYQTFKILEYRLPLYKKRQNINAEFMPDKEHGENEKYSLVFKDYTTSHHLMVGDALIIGAVAAAGYFAYNELFKQ